MRYRLFVLTILTVLVGVWGAGCAGSETPAFPSDEPTMPSTPTPEPQPTTSVPTPSAEPIVGVVPPEAQHVVALAREDLAERLEMAPGAIELVSVEAVEWANTSLGCPKPGERYGETVNSGFRLVLRAGGERYAYHTLRDRKVILCKEVPVVDTPTPPSRVDSGLDGLIQSAKDDLAQRLSIKPDQIEVVEARSVVWPDASIGCPQPGTQYAQVVTPGFLVVLEAGDETYEYHADTGDRLILCEGETTSPLPTIPVTPGEILDGDPWMPAD